MDVPATPPATVDDVVDSNVITLPTRDVVLSSAVVGCRPDSPVMDDAALGTSSLLPII